MVREYTTLACCTCLLLALVYSAMALLQSKRSKFTFDACILIVQAVIVTALAIYEFMCTHLLLLLGL